MCVLTGQLTEYLEKGSWIRRIFETGIELKKKYGSQAVCDFSLGNPDLPPPPIVGECLSELAQTASTPFAFGYMPNPGYPEVRQALATKVSQEQGVPLSATDILVTAGAAGGINTVLRAVLEPGDEVVCPSPYFLEYKFYVENFKATLRPVLMPAPAFDLDVGALAGALTEKTRVVLINSPHNPTGAVYGEEALDRLCVLLEEHSRKIGHPVLLIADEPYRFLTYDGVEVPPILPRYPYTVLISSFSKNLALAGERVGYIALSPDMPDRTTIMNGLVFSSRVLGFVNAPAIGQKILLKALGENVDVASYARRRDMLGDILTEAGFEFAMPSGTFYFFVAAPGGDDIAFVNRLQEKRILAVPGTGFGAKGFFRLAFCVEDDVIERSRAGFLEMMGKA
ncbi:pyridoxal phosphate-dependent aminotransferase [Desulfovibrio inopinatus]|uniref:pyridoxal phosphate-dependent aminotransferase n=1 Tax=Desulfovibrio inopinatus TaxID=102109 RepID=UPI0004147777|nr:pyridoxal phosphate-dependent aminotransferase [Desulfovibrio inopinatus]